MHTNHGDSGERRRDWEQRYTEQRTGWDRGAVSPSLQRWLDAGALPRGRVLVPGCGHGYEVEELAQRGFAVTGIDITPVPLQRLGQRLRDRGLDAELVEADLLHWQPTGPFAAIYEQTCLCALDPVHREAYAQRLHAWLAPGGKLFALFMQTGRDGGPPFDCPVDVMRALFDAQHWRFPAEADFEVAHPAGLREIGFVLERR